MIKKCHRSINVYIFALVLDFYIYRCSYVVMCNFWTILTMTHNTIFDRTINLSDLHKHISYSCVYIYFSFSFMYTYIIHIHVPVMSSLLHTPSPSITCTDRCQIDVTPYLYISPICTSKSSSFSNSVFFLVHTSSSCANSGTTRNVRHPRTFLVFKMSPKMWSPTYSTSWS